MEAMLTEGTCHFVEPKYSCLSCGKECSAWGFRIADLCGDCFSAGLIWAAKQARAEQAVNASSNLGIVGIGTLESPPIDQHIVIEISTEAKGFLGSQCPSGQLHVTFEPFMGQPEKTLRQIAEEAVANGQDPIEAMSQAFRDAKASRPFKPPS